MSHIVIACPDCGGQSSVGIVALRHAGELAQAFDVTVISVAFPNAGGAKINYHLARPARFDALRRFCHVPNELAMAISFRAALNRIHQRRSVDFVLLHGHVLAYFVGRGFWARTGVPYGLVIHGDIHERPAGTYHWTLSALYKAVTRRACIDADLVLPVSPHLRDRLRAYGVSDAKIISVPNGIDLDRFEWEQDRRKRTDDEDSDRAFRLLFVGRLTAEKGVIHLLEACKLLLAQGRGVHLDIVGEGPLKAALADRIAEFGLEHCVTLHGQVNRPSLGAFYAQADGLCLPSLSESWPLAALEGMAFGLPVIASAVGGLRHLIRDHENGLLCTPASASELARQIARLRDSPHFRRELGRAALLSAHEHSWHKVGTVLVRSCRQAIERHCEASVQPHQP